MKRDIKKHGIHVKKGQSALEALQTSVPHWIHDTKEDKSSVTGVIYLPGCTCSICGFHVNMEKAKCPHCGTDMRKMKGL